MPVDRLARSTLPALVAAVVAVGCVTQDPAVPEGTGVPTATPAESASSSAPIPSGEVTDPTALIECRQVPEDVCFEYAISMIRGPQPDYAIGAGIERVLVTCERLPPCGADRRDSGGKIMILYSNGWAWTQDWAVMSGG